MAKKQNKPEKACADCIHENACRAWVDGRYIADESANRCPNYETVKESAAYLCGVLDERKRKQSNADRIRSMTDEELADMLWKTGRNYRAVCADPVVDHNEQYAEIVKWLKQPAEEGNNGETE